MQPEASAGGAHDDRRRWRRRGWAAAAGLFCLWAVLPPLTMPNIGHDAAEGLIWGRAWDLGYPKHPPLQAWLLEATRLLFGTSTFAHVWLSALCVAVMHLAVQRAGEEVTSPANAFWASAALQTVYYTNYTTPEFNPNVLQLPAWAAAGALALIALRRGGAWWIALGAVLGAGMYAKYSVALVVAAIALFFLVDPGGRRRLASPWPYAGAAAALAVFAPHLLWLAGEGGTSVSYAVDRAQIAPGLAERFANIGEFAGTSLAVSLPLGAALWLGRERRAAGGGGAADGDAAGRRLVVWLALAPFAFTALLALVAGFRIKAAWLAPFWTFIPLAAFLALGIDAGRRAWRRGAAVTAAMAMLGLGAYLAVNLWRPHMQGRPMRIHFPGAALAAEVDRLWAGATTAPLKVVIGDTLPAGSVGHYSRFSPLARVGDVEAVNPWVPEALIGAAGAVVLWDAAREGDALPSRISERRPSARVLAVVELRHQTSADVAPARIGVAILDPAPVGSGGLPE